MAIWQITAVDTMKDSRDTCYPVSNQLTPGVIAQGVNLCASLSVTHITCDVFYDYPDYLALWVSAIRATGKAVWFRSHWNTWEGNNGTSATMTPAQYLTATIAFLQAHPTLFQSGDILDACAEPNNSPYWVNTYGANYTNNAPNTATDAFNAYLLNLDTQMQTTLNNLGITGVNTKVRSLNSFWAKSINVLYPSTVAQLGNVTIDTYPEGSSTDPATCANARLAELQLVVAARPGVPIILGELGYSNAVTVTDDQQNAVLAAELAAVATIPTIIGMNYWVAQGSETSGGHTHLFGGVRGAWTLRPAAITLANFYQQQRLGWLRADMQQVTVGGVPVPVVANSINISQAIGQRTTATFQVLDTSGVYSFLQGQPVAIFAPPPGNMLSYNQSSVETDTTGFTAQNGATLTRDTSQFWQGTASLKCVTPGSVAFEGFIAYLPSGSVQAGEQLTLSCYLTAAAGTTLGVFLYSNVLGAILPTRTVTLSGPLGTWQRVTISMAIPPGTPSGLYGLRVNTTAAQALTFYADGLQVEAGTVASPWSGGIGPMAPPYQPFSGVVISSRRSNPGWASGMIHDLACADWHYLADKRIAATTYSNQTVGFMVSDLCNTYLASEGVTIQRGVNKYTPQQSDVEGTDMTQVSFLPGNSVTISQDTTPGNASHGAGCLKVVTSGGAFTFEQIEVHCPSTFFAASQQVTISAYVKSAAGTPTLRYFLQSDTGAIGGTQNVVLSTNWQRVTRTVTLPNPFTNAWIGLRFDTGSPAQAVTFFLDQMQIEIGPAATAWELGGLPASIASGPTVSSFLVNYVPVSKAYDDLAQMAGYTWQIDANKVLWFLPTTALPAPWQYDGTQADDSSGAGGQTVEETNPLYRNAQWILSIKDVTASQTETRQGDGKLTAFTMSYPLHSVPTVTVNAVSKTVGIGQVDTGKDWYWNQGSNVLSQDPAGVKLVSTDTLSVTYIGEWVSNVYSQSGGAIATELATEGGVGTGIVEEAHTDATITTSAQGFQLAGSLLSKYAQIGRTLSFRTRSSGLAPQQLLSVNLPPAWNMAGTQALIESVTVTEDGLWWLYDVKALVGPVNDTWVQYFQRIANPLGTLPGTSGTQQTVALLQSETAAWNWTAATYTATVTACPVFPLTFPVTFC